MVLSFLFFVIQAHAASVPLPWPGQNPGYTGPAQQAPPAMPIQGLIVQPQAPPSVAPAAPQQQPLQNQQLMNMLQQMGQSGKRNTYFDEGGADLTNGYSSNRGFKLQTASHGELENCDSPPPIQRVKAAYEEAMKFRASCEEAQRGDSQLIVINDFAITGQREMPYMYIFDQKGNCLKKTAVTYGNGLGNTFPQACSDANCHLTPPGFHLTVAHDSDSYPAGTSLGMAGLEGQGSNGRGVLIHPAASPGTASSFGCAGVGPFDAVKRMIGEGALVYNYFAPDDAAKGCKSHAGMDHTHGCRLEVPRNSVPATATGSGTTTSR